MKFTVDIMTDESIKSMKIDASNQKEAKIKIKKKIGKERIIGVKLSD